MSAAPGRLSATPRTLWLAAVPAIACAAPAPTPAQQPLPGATADTTGLPPAGYGTLRQEEVAIRLQTAHLNIQVLPLDDRVIRLLAPDTYESLARLKESRSKEIRRDASRHAIQDPTLFLVVFLGLQDRTRFEPELLTVTAQNRFFRPVEILPLSPLWNGRQLNLRETATAIYIFEGGIRILDPFTVAYQGIENRDWEQRIRVLDRERASAIARAARGSGL